MTDHTRASGRPLPTCHVTLTNGAAVTIRPLAATDGPALGDFYASVPAEDEFFYCPHPLTRSEAEKKAAQAAGPTLVCLVLETTDGGIAGYAWYRWKADGDRKSLLGICIRRDFQGSGAGRALTERLLEIARTVGPPIMSLTVQKANPRAVALYKKMGFHIVRDQLRKEDGEPEYYMEQRVRPDPATG